jgi:hypothetical protein
MGDLPKPTCADCVAYLTEYRPPAGPAKGRCRLRAELGTIPDTLPACESFRVRAESKGLVSEPATKPARRPRSTPRRTPVPPKDVATLRRPVVGDTSGEIDMDRDGLKQIMRELMEEETLYGYPALGEKWDGGRLVLKPADASMQSKEVEIESFFHKIVMLRDRLRVLEAKVNGHAKLSEQDKVELQAYVSKCYGTLTTFNVLFADKADHFSTK